MFDKHLMANLLLHFLNTALLFVEVDGKWTTERTLAPKIRKNPTMDAIESEHGSYVISGHDYMPSTTKYTVDYGGRFMPLKTSKLSEVFVKSKSQIVDNGVIVSGAEARLNKLDNKKTQREELTALDKDRSKENSFGRFLYKLVKSVHNFIRNDAINTRVKEVKELNNSMNIDLSAKQEKELAEDKSLEQNAAAFPETKLQTLSPLQSDVRTYSTGLKRAVLELKRTFPFRVAVVVSKPRGRRRDTTIFVPLSVDMTVLDAFSSATRLYMHNNNSGEDGIPFNIRLDWNEDLQCYVTVQAVGFESRRRQAWYFTVRNYTNEIIYKGRCLPGDDVILRPRSSVQLTFEQTRRPSN